MSRDNLSGLLDAMLDDSTAEMREREQADQQEKLREEQERQASLLRAKLEEKPEAPLFEDVETLTGLTDEDLRAVLGKAVPDNLLIVLATSSDALQRRILANLDPTSVKWMRDNLTYVEEVTGAERRAAHGGLLKVANKLLAAGTIGLPEPDAVGTGEAPDAEDKALKEMLLELARIAKQSGPVSLSETVAKRGEPMLALGLALVVSGERGPELRASLAPLHDAL
ncbi:MAG: hypothetical protein IT378_20290, partial [Sandaracinaceae bacterium]|nr:hypothetical protein [Sandaracinaceae bacterium]